MRPLRHLLGILIRSYESETEITLAHLRNFLEIRRVPKSEVDRYYISPPKGKKIIDGFSSKDESYTQRRRKIERDAWRRRSASQRRD